MMIDISSFVARGVVPVPPKLNPPPEPLKDEERDVLEDACDADVPEDSAALTSLAVEFVSART